MHPGNTNRLANETSPYLLQHADNPVDWHPWGEKALSLARKTGKPVLLSIGYSACHWCHVMAHESFEDPATAAVMNELFVNIKVDREERPDIDKLYQTAHQLLAQRPGGWPLTVFLDPDDLLPFFAGTYFPSQPRHGMPAFTEVLRRVADFYRQSGDEIAAQKGPLTDVFARIDATETTTQDLDDSPLRALRRQLEESFDARYGGFGAAPKFPHPVAMERLLHHWAGSRNGEPDKRALHMAVFSLGQMIRGGIYDQLGGGFCRYSVDERWHIPHFEKMLYDNGPLLALCAETAAATGDVMFCEAAIETADWALREMRHPDGAFYSALDADSEGEEGRFYAWEADEVRAVVGDKAWPLVASRFGLDQPPNFEGRHHLWRATNIAALADTYSADESVVCERLSAARKALYDVREERVRPGLDDKILTSWNALMIRGLAIASRRLDRPDYAEAAAATAHFIYRELWQDGRLLATWKDGRARLPAYLDDHAFLVDALMELLQCRWDGTLMEFAVELADLLLARFEDAGNGGFFFTADDHEQLFHRSRTLSDDATPSGNGVAAKALLRLGYLLGENRYIDAAERTLRAGWDAMRQHPQAHASLVTALAEFLAPAEMLVLRGEPGELDRWRRRIDADYRPARLCFAIPSDAGELPGGLAARTARGEIFAYLCRGHTCTAGSSPDELLGSH